MLVDLNAQAGNSSFLIPHVYPGRLITAEGLDGSGKSTQLQLLSYWLRIEGYEVTLIEWTPSKLTKSALKASRKQDAMEPTLLSMLHAADVAEMYLTGIVPALQRGAIVLVDRYVYTALARDLARGVEQQWIEHVYQFAALPDLSVYFQLSLDQALSRILDSGNSHTKRQRQGRSLETDYGTLESFRTFQQGVINAYEKMREKFSLCLDANLPVRQQQRLLRSAVEKILPNDV